MVRIERGTDGRMVLYNSPYGLKDIIKQVPGRRWAPKLKAWTFPKNLRCFKQLIEMFPDAMIDDGLKDFFETQATLMAAAMEAKSAPDGTLPYPDHCVQDPLPWHHQVKSFHFALNRLVATKGVMLALDMGCGKSRVAVEIARNLQCNKVLVICPKTVVGWEDQFAEWAPYLYPVCDLREKGGSTARRAKKAREFLKTDGSERGVVIINKDAVWRSKFAEFVLHQQWDLIIVDECHRAKSPGGKYSRFLDRLRRAQPMAKIAGLTGTPMPHSPLDIYAQGRFIDPSVYGTNYTSFKYRYAVFGGYGGYQILYYQNLDELRELFESFAIQVRKRDVLDLPEVTHLQREVVLSDEEMDIYKQFRDEMIVEIRDGTVTAANALVKLLRLSQIVQGWVKNTEGDLIQVGDSKAVALKETIEDLPVDEPIVVFSRFKSDLDSCVEICEKLETQRECYQIRGGLNQVKEWEERCRHVVDGEPAPVISIQLQSGSEGLNELVAARYCIYASVDWSLGNYDQSLARIDRPGQTRNVTYIHLTAKSTVDMAVYKSLQKRRNIVEATLGIINKG